MRLAARTVLVPGECRELPRRTRRDRPGTGMALGPEDERGGRTEEWSWLHPATAAKGLRPKPPHASSILVPASASSTSFLYTRVQSFPAALIVAASHVGYLRSTKKRDPRPLVVEKGSFPMSTEP